LNASKTTSRNLHLIFWTKITWICSEYWAKKDYIYIFDTSEQAVDFCSTETSSRSSKFSTAADKSHEFFSSWTALISTISTAKFSVFQKKTSFFCRWKKDFSDCWDDKATFLWFSRCADQICNSIKWYIKHELIRLSYWSWKRSFSDYINQKEISSRNWFENERFSERCEDN